MTVGVDVSGSEKVWRTFQAIGDIAFAYAYSTVLVEIQASPFIIIIILMNRQVLLFIKPIIGHIYPTLINFKTKACICKVILICKCIYVCICICKHVSILFVCIYVYMFVCLIAKNKS